MLLMYKTIKSLIDELPDNEEQANYALKSIFEQWEKTFTTLPIELAERFDFYKKTAEGKEIFQMINNLQQAIELLEYCRSVYQEVNQNNQEESYVFLEAYDWLEAFYHDLAFLRFQYEVHTSYEKLPLFKPLKYYEDWYKSIFYTYHFPNSDRFYHYKYDFDIFGDYMEEELKDICSQLQASKEEEE
ncbi:hypothetical protein [Gallibacterium anatis]|uniref:hypothetical protein n=1 Tax=Gallibacterium anatis TaxID=750 RepID=UPI00053145EA|nr:hypothetical protein [Gallibacterium anatis]KGQ44495.1 hypothetical protein JP29_09115 [Gallibacterium anatis]